MVLSFIHTFAVYCAAPASELIVAIALSYIIDSDTLRP